MSVFRRGRLKVVRWAIGVGVLAASSFAMAGVAQATSGVANPSNFTGVPNLRSVSPTGLPSQVNFCFLNQVANRAGIAGNQFALIGYRWNTKAVGFGTPSTTSGGGQLCVTVNITPKPSPGSGNRDLASYSLGSVNAGQVVNESGAALATGNIADSAPYLGSTAFSSHSGTAGHTQGPGLQSLVGGAAGVDTTGNGLLLQFDHVLSTNSTQLTASSCHRVMVYDANGVAHYGVLVGANSSGQAEAFFGPQQATNTNNACAMINNSAGTSDANFSVAQARRVVVFRSNASGDEGMPVNQGNPQTAVSGVPTTGQCISDQGGDPQTCGPTEGIPIPGAPNFGETNRPDLISAVINPQSNTIDATFSVPVNVGANTAASDAVAVLSDGEEEQASQEQVIGSAPVNGVGISNNVVRFTFNGAPFGGGPANENEQKFSEMVVKLSVYGQINGTATTTNGIPSTSGTPCAVRDLNAPNNCNTTGGVPVGGNQGAFITGFASGPDPMYMIVSRGTGLIRIGFDQRVDPSTIVPASFNVYDSTGTFINNLASASINVVDNGFTSEVDIQATPTSVAQLADLQIVGQPWAGSALASWHGFTTTPNGNVVSVISPTSIAAKFRAAHRAARATAKKLRSHKHATHRRHRR